MNSRLALGALILACSAGISARAELRWGRAMDQSPRVTLAPSLGRVTRLEGSVEETVRPYYELTEPGKSAAYAESYTLEELGFKDGDTTLGLAFEATWSFFTLQVNGLYMESSVNSTARRNYYIGVSEVEYEGREYEYMVIPSGQAFEADMQSGALGLRGIVTPVSLDADRLSLTPGVYLGAVSYFSEAKLDAGPAQGLVEYENPPRPYVVGGRATGRSILVLPEIGLYGEARFRAGTEQRRGLEIALQGYYALLDYAGSTDDFGISSRNEKTLDMDLDHYEARLLASLPLTRHTELLLGVAVEHLRVEADVRARDASAEEIEARREKFNKLIRLDFSVVSALVGLRF